MGSDLSIVDGESNQPSNPHPPAESGRTSEYIDYAEALAKLDLA